MRTWTPGLAASWREMVSEDGVPRKGEPGRKTGGLQRLSMKHRSIPRRPVGPALKLTEESLGPWGVGPGA